MSLLKRLPPWIILVFGMLLGCTLTSTLTFHLWWCSSITEERTMNLLLGRTALPLTQHIVHPTTLNSVEASKLASTYGNSGSQLHNKSFKLQQGEVHHEGGGNASKMFNETNLRPDMIAAESARDRLVVAVLSTHSQPEWAESAYEMWGRDAKQLLIFVGDNFNYSDSSAQGLPLVRLTGAGGQGHSVGAAHSANTMLSLLQYLSDHYLPSHQWFMLALVDSYVRMDRLEQLLTQLNPKEMLYLGRSATGRKEDVEMLDLKPHESYCLGSSGLVLSSALLKGLKEHLEKCRGEGVPGDVALGKCISRNLGLQCTQSLQSRNYFFEDYSGHPLTQDYLNKRRDDMFGSLISYHPVPSLEAMRRLHLHYKQIQFTSLLDKLHLVQKQLVEVCSSSVRTSSLSYSDPSPSPSLTDCVPTVCPGDEKRYTDSYPNAGVVSSLSSPYLPTTIYDYQPWVYFDSMTLYTGQQADPSYRLKIKKNWRQELQKALTKAVQKTSEHHGRPLKFKRLVNGWVRHSPFLGNEYIIDLLLMDGGRKVFSKRVNLVRPLGTNYITRKDNADSDTFINMVVPLTKVNQRFKEFMVMYEELVLIANERVNLILSVYGEEDVRFVSNVVESYHSKYPSAHMAIVEGKGQFSRSKALHTAITHLESDQLIFVCDVDMKVTPPFLERCRRNTIQGKRVYYPEFFKLYNMDYVYWNQPRPKHVSLKRANGHWAYYSFGMLCIYKSDYLAVGGMDTNIEGWGEEDVQFFSKVIRSRLDVLRAPDKSLSHRWHEKHCAKNLSSKQYKHCLSSQQENLADRKELARYIQEKGVEIKGMGGVADLASNVTVEDEQDDYD